MSHKDAKKALHIFGDEPATIKGKTTRIKQSKIKCIHRVKLPYDILKRHNKVHIMVNYMFVQGVQFSTTILYELKFRTAEALRYAHKKGAKKEDILTGLQKVINLYQSRGLIVEQVHGDNEFECVKEDIRPILMNISAADEHVSMVERSIRTIKDRTRSQIQHLLYSRFPKAMIIGYVIFAVKSLNSEIGICRLFSNYSPHTLVTGQPARPYNQIVSMTYGEYAEVYAANPITNDNNERTISAIALYPSGNHQDGWIFMSLNTGRLLHRHQWKKLHVDQNIIDKVNNLGAKEK